MGILKHIDDFEESVNISIDENIETKIAPTPKIKINEDVECVILDKIDDLPNQLTFL